MFLRHTVYMVIPCQYIPCSVDIRKRVQRVGELSCTRTDRMTDRVHRSHNLCLGGGNKY